MWRTDECNDILRSEYGKGRYTTAQLAQQFQVSQGSLIRYAHTLGLKTCTRGKGVTRARREHHVARSGPTLLPSLAPEPIFPIVTPPRPQRATRSAPSGKPNRSWSPWKTCQWIDGPEASGPRCGCTTMAGQSWCREHYERVYVRVGRKDAA